MRAEWITSEMAADMLCCSIWTVYGMRDVISHRDKAGKGHGKGKGYQWLRCEVEETRRIMGVCRLMARQAANVMRAKREGRL